MWDKITWFFDELLIWFQNIWNDFLGSFATVIEAIPVPDFMINVGSYAVPDSILYFAGAFNLTIGVGIIVTAYTLRFFIRRIPVIG